MNAQAPIKVCKAVKNQGNMTPPKEHSAWPITDPKEMGMCEGPSKELKIVF